jgi:hypothetical protein
VVGVIALPLALAAGAAAAPRKPQSPPSPEAPAGQSSWVADELRILRADVESLRQRPEPSVAADVAALRSEVAKLAAAQADLERRLGSAPAPAQPLAIDRGVGLTGALVMLVLGVALGWVGSRLTQRWRDRRQRIRV